MRFGTQVRTRSRIKARYENGPRVAGAPIKYRARVILLTLRSCLVILFSRRVWSAIDTNLSFQCGLLYQRQLARQGPSACDTRLKKEPTLAGCETDRDHRNGTEVQTGIIS